MTVTSLGSLTVGEINAGLAIGLGAATASLGAQLPEIQAKLDGLAIAQALLIATPPVLGVQLANAVDLVAQITLSISLGVPDVTFQLDAVVDQIATLTATQAALNAQLSLITGLADLLGLGGVEAFTFDGICSNFASELGAYTNGGFAGGSAGSQGYAIVITAGTPELWAALQEIFGL